MIFNLWSQARIGEYEVAFDVTRANIPRVGSGDAEWVAACLDAIGVSGTAQAWSIEAARCHFYSDYAEEPEWRDRWPDTWMVRVKLDGSAPDGLESADPLQKLIDQYDRTWEYGAVDPAHDRRALLVLLVPGSSSEVARLRDQTLALLPSEIPASTQTIESAGRGWLRQRITVTGPIFPDRIPALESFLQACRQRNMIVNRNQLD